MEELGFVSFARLIPTRRLGTESRKGSCKMTQNTTETGRIVLPDLAGKRVLVTGSGGGLGKRMAIEFARQRCEVLVHYFTRKKEAADVVLQCKKVGAKSVSDFGADLRSEAAIEKLFQTANDRMGGLDILINNAGMVFKSAAEDCGAACFDDVYSVNVRAPYLLSRLFHASKQPDGKGVIINNTSIHSTFGGVEYMSAYGMSKGALNALTQSLATEWAPNIRVLAIAPGAVPVERNAAVLASPESTKMWMPHMPTGRFGDPEDIALTTLFLASDVSTWTSGSIVTVDGGMCARINMPLRAKPGPPAAPLPIQHPEDC